MQEFDKESEVLRQQNEILTAENKRLLAQVNDLEQEKATYTLETDTTKYNSMEYVKLTKENDSLKQEIVKLKQV